MKKKNIIFVIGLILCFVFYYLTRSELFSFQHQFKMQNADFAVYALIAEDIMNFESFPFYYYGQNYMGPLTSLFMILIQSLLNLFNISQSLVFDTSSNYLIGPLTLSLTPFVMTFLGLIFYALGFKKLFGLYRAILSIFIMSIGNKLLMIMSIRPNGWEMAFMLAGLLTWRGIELIEKNSKTNQILFGFFFGFSWWMNQTVVFALAPIIFYFVSDSDQYKHFRESLKFKDRLLLNLDRLGYKKIPSPLKLFLYFVYAILLINFLMGVVISALGGVNTILYGIKLKILNGFSPMKTSIIIFMAIQLIFWMFNQRELKKKLHSLFFPIRYFIYSLIIGYGPVILGRIFNLYDKAYGVKFQFVSLSHLSGYWKRLILDFFPGLFTKDLHLLDPWSSLIGPLFFTLLLLCFFLIFLKEKSAIFNYLSLKAVKHSKYSVLWGVVFFNMIYVFLADRARDQYAYRYAMLIIPIICIFIISIPSFFKDKKVLGYIYSTVLFITLSIASYYQGLTYLEDHKENDDIKEKIEYLISSDCEVFFTDYWKTYLYQWHLQERKQFAVTRGQDRTPKRTLELKNSNKKKCLLRDDWSIAEI